MLCVAGISFSLLQTMIIPALPALQREYHAGVPAVMWVVTIFLITASIATPIVGRAGDMFGKDRVLVVVLVVFGLGSLLCALAPSLELLIAGRAVQGIGGAIFPLAFGIIRDEFPRAQVGIGIGLISAVHGLGGATGLVVSGVIVDHLNQAWIFWLALFVTLPAIFATRLFVPESPVRSPARIDWIGALGMSAALGALLLGVAKINAWGLGSPQVAGLFAVAAGVTGAWIWYELRVPEPLIDIRMMRMCSVWTTNVTAATLGFSMLSSILLVPQLVQIPASAGFGFGATATQTGLYLVPQPVAIMIGAPMSAWLSGRLGSRVPLLVGISLGLACFIQIILLHNQPWHILVHGAVNGLAVGLSFAAMVNLVVGAVPQSHTSVATGMNMIMRSVGGAFQAQVAAAVLAATATVAGVPTETGFQVAFSISAVLMLAALAAALTVPPPRSHGPPKVYGSRRATP